MIKHTQAVFKHITHGVYVISVINGEQRNAFTASWVMQVSFDPLLVCFSINPDHHSYQLLKQGGVCCISVLDNGQLDIADHFGRSGIKDKMKGHSWQETVTKAPALTESLAYFDCHVDHFSDAGDHKLAICKVIDAAILNEGAPLLYCDTDDMDKSSNIYK